MIACEKNSEFGIPVPGEYASRSGGGSAELFEAWCEEYIAEQALEGVEVGPLEALDAWDSMWRTMAKEAEDSGGDESQLSDARAIADLRCGAISADEFRRKMKAFLWWDSASIESFVAACS
jgi:hypothetical protein